MGIRAGSNQRPVEVTLVGCAQIVLGGLVLGRLLYWAMRNPEVFLGGVPLSFLLFCGAAILVGPVVGAGVIGGRGWAWFVASTTWLGVGCVGLVLVAWNVLYGLPTYWVLGLITVGIAAAALTAYGMLQGARARVYFGRETLSPWKALAGHVALLGVCIGIASGVGMLRIVSALLAEQQQLLATRSDALNRIGTGGLASATDVTFMLEALGSETVEERLLAAWALGETGTTQAVSRLVDLARSDPDASVRLNAVGAAVKLGGSEIESLLVDCLEDSDAAVRAAALHGLADARFAAAAPVVAMGSSDPDPEVRANVVDALGRMASPAVVPELIVALGDREANVRARTAFALGRIGDARAVDALLGGLQDASWEVRANAAQALGMIGEQRARAALTERLDDPNDQVRIAARRALARIP